MKFINKNNPCPGPTNPTKMARTKQTARKSTKHTIELVLDIILSQLPSDGGVGNKTPFRFFEFVIDRNGITDNTTNRTQYQRLKSLYHAKDVSSQVDQRLADMGLQFGFLNSSVDNPFIPGSTKGFCWVSPGFKQCRASDAKKQSASDTNANIEDKDDSHFDIFGVHESETTTTSTTTTSSGEGTSSGVDFANKFQKLAREVQESAVNNQCEHIWTQVQKLQKGGCQFKKPLEFCWNSNIPDAQEVAGKIRSEDVQVEANKEGNGVLVIFGKRVSRKRKQTYLDDTDDEDDGVYLVSEQEESEEDKEEKKHETRQRRRKKHKHRIEY